MAVDVGRPGPRYGGGAAAVDRDRARAYAAATNDDNPAYESGGAVPPVFGVVASWPALVEAVSDLIPSEAQALIVHGEHDMWFHQPLEAGSMLVSHAELYGLRAARSGSRLTLRVASADTSGALVLEQYATIFVRDLKLGPDVGPEKPDHRFPREARSRTVGEHTVHIDADQTYRYRDASGDTMPIHVDDAFARHVGLPGIIVHGLCTMAMCGQAVVAGPGGGDPTRLTRLAVRFSRPVFPGTDLTTTLYEVESGADPAVYAFEAASGGHVVVRDGRAEVAGSSRPVPGR